MKNLASATPKIYRASVKMFCFNFVLGSEFAITHLPSLERE